MLNAKFLIYFTNRRFFYDSQKTLDSLIVDKKREYMKKLMLLDSEYGKICTELETELESKVKKINYVCDAIDNLDFEFEKVRF